MDKEYDYPSIYDMKIDDFISDICRVLIFI